MSFLSPWSALLVAAIAIPALVLLYLLKLRRQPLRMASTLLWRQAYEDLQANVPFQRLRYTPLLLIQLLLLAALILAFAQPVLLGGIRPASRTILLIDVSASMSATDVDPDDAQRTRFDDAISEARRIIDGASRSDRAARVMIIAFGRSPRVISSFESNRAILLDALQRIRPTDEQADLSQALRLAGVFASRAEADNETPQVVLISDGGVGTPATGAGFELRSGRFRYVRVGPAADQPINNVGITAFTARRNFENTSRVDVFGRLINAGAVPIELAATIRVDGGDALPLLMTIPAADESGAGERSFTAALEVPGNAVLTLAHNHNDTLSSDNAAAAVLPAPRPLRLAIVHPADDAEADPFIVELLEAADPAALLALTLAQFESRVDDADGLNEPWDLVVFDRVAPRRFPGVPTLTFGAVPPMFDVVASAPRGGQAVLSWDRQHPLMQYVELDAVRYAGFSGFLLPAGATALARGPGGPIIATHRAAGVEHVAVGFELRRSDWPLHVSFAVFMQNVLDQLVTSRAVEALTYQPGETIAVTPKFGAERIAVTGPQAFDARATNDRVVTLGPIELAGLYEASNVQPPHDVLAVNVASDRESDIRPVWSLRVNAEQAEAAAAATTARPLWPWFVAAAVVLLIVEWLAWCARTRA